MQFKAIRGYRLEVGSTGHSNGRMLVFRLIGGVDEWAQIGNARVFLIGGDSAKHELKRLLSDVGRPTLQERIPDGISGSVHTTLREYVGL